MHFLIYNPQNATWRTGSLGWISRIHHPGSDENLSENRYEQEGSSNGFNLAICSKGRSYKWGLALLADQRRKNSGDWKQKVQQETVLRDRLTVEVRAKILRDRGTQCPSPQQNKFPHNSLCIKKHQVIKGRGSAIIHVGTWCQHFWEAQVVLVGMLAVRAASAQGLHSVVRKPSAHTRIQARHTHNEQESALSSQVRHLNQNAAIKKKPYLLNSWSIMTHFLWFAAFFSPGR